MFKTLKLAEICHNSSKNVLHSSYVNWDILSLSLWTTECCLHSITFKSDTWYSPGVAGWVVSQEDQGTSIKGFYITQ